MNNSAEIKRLLQAAQVKDQQIRDGEIRTRSALTIDLVQQQQEIKKRAIETKWRNVGVLGIFEDLRDSGTVTLHNNPVYWEKTVPRFFGNTVERQLVSNFTPARITFTEDCCSLEFDKRTVPNHWPDAGDNYMISCISAVIRSGELCINEVKVEENGLASTVATAITIQKGYRQ